MCSPFQSALQRRRSSTPAPQISNTRSIIAQHPVAVELVGPKRLLITFWETASCPNPLSDLENALGFVMFAHRSIKRSAIGKTLCNQRIVGPAVDSQIASDFL